MLAGLATVVWIEASHRAHAEAPANQSTVELKGAPPVDPDAPPVRFVASGAEAEKKPLNRKHAPPPDPIEANGTIFEDWPKPDAALVLTGEQMGYLEPCGCAGLTNQKGGLKRRSTFLKQLREDGWPVVALDAGGQVKRYGPQAEIKFRRALESLAEIGYQGVGLGAQDLRMEVLGVALNFEPGANPLVSANVGLLDFDPDFSRRFGTAEAGGIKFGFTSVLADSEAAKLGEVPDATIFKAADGLAQAMPGLEQARCNELVLMVYGNRDEATALAKKFPKFRWVVAAVGADEPPHIPAKIAGTNSYLIEVGHKGMYAVTIGFYRSGDTPFRYQKVPLDHRFEDAADMQAMLESYQQELKTLGLDGLGAKPLPDPGGQKFAGSAACQDCHTAAWEVFEKTPHAHATQTLIDLKPARHFDPECLSCHVVGWSPQKYQPYASGYTSLEATPHLLDQGCENCHGPAARHVAAENYEIDIDDAGREALRAALRMEIGENEGNQTGQKLGRVVNNCLECHDLDNSPDFDFQPYWEEVKHYGKD